MALHSRHIAYLMAATLFTVLQTSCRKEKDLEVSQEIVLSASLDDATRGMIASADALGNESQNIGTGIGVFGYKTVDGSAHTQIFPNTKVTYTGKEWTYSPKKFWDKKAYYHFVAYWPHSANATDLDIHTMSIGGIPNWQIASGDASDVLIAYSQNDALTYLGNNEYEGKVPFKFKHALAKVIIKAWYYGSRDNVPYITKLTLGSVPVQNGTSSIQCDYDDSHTTTYSTPASGDAILMEETASGDAVYAVTQYFETKTKGENSKLRTTMCTWLAFPFGTEQTASVPITIEYKFKANGTKLTPKNGNVPLGHLEAGNTYILTLNFDASGEILNLDDIIVKQWEPGRGIAPEVYNW